MNTSKDWIDSKTIWFNAIATLLGIVPIVGALLKIIEPSTAVLVDAVVITADGIGNVILRVWFTAQPITTTRSIKAGYEKPR